MKSQQTNINNKKRVRVKDAERIAKQIAENALSPAEYEQLSNEEVWRFEEHIIDLVARHKAAFARLDQHLVGVVLQVLESVIDEAQVRRARVDSNAFMEYVFVDDVSGEPVKQAALHKRWQATMNKYKQSLIIGPREHGKSTQVVGFALWKLGNNSNLRIKVISNNDKEANKRILEMQLHIETNKRYQRVFPNVKPADRGRWNSERFYVKRDRVMREPSVEGYGVLSAGTGGRCDLMILDDVVDRKNALTQPSLRKAVKEAVKSDWLALLSDGGVVISICTLWHKDDLNCDLGGRVLTDMIRHADGKCEKPDQSNLEEGEWYVSFDAIGDDFTPVWDDLWPKHKLEAKRRQVGRSAFNRGWRNRVVDDSETAVDSNWIFYYQRGTLPPRSELFLLQSYDLAISLKEGKKKSWFTCTTLGARFTPRGVELYVLDVFRKKRLSFPNQVRIIKQGFKALKPDVIVLESNAYQAALYQQLLDTTILPVVPVVSKINKALRLESVTPAMEAGHVMFSARLDPDRNKFVGHRGDLVGELLDFPFGNGDDMVDSFSQGVRYVQEYATTLASYGDQLQYGEANVYMLDGELDGDDPLYPSMTLEA